MRFDAKSQDFSLPDAADRLRAAFYDGRNHITGNHTMKDRNLKRRLRGLALSVAVLVSLAAPASAQKFFNYTCADGSQLTAAFIPQSKSAYLQLDGKSMSLPQRLSASGARYAKGGVTFWIKGNSAQLKRPKKKWTECSTVS
jgi:membrane-bound inhibitor of C-type lysozyme